MARYAFVPDLGLGLVYLAAWAVPSALGPAPVSWLVLGIELEAAAILGAYGLAIAHLAIMDRDGSWKTRLGGLAIVLAITGFAAVQVIRYGFWWPALALLALVANRLAGVLGGNEDENLRLERLQDALWSGMTYLLAIAPTFYLAIPSPSALGPLPAEHARWCALPADLVYEAFEEPVRATWCAEPHRALAGGALYFLFTAFRGARRARKDRDRR